MFTSILLAIFFAAAFFSAENLVSIIVGGLVSMGLAQWVKNGLGAYGPAALIIAVIIAAVVSIAALFVASLFTGTTIDWTDLPKLGAQLFALATIGYNLFVKDQNE